MAFCPECKGQIPATAIACDSCGYDFPKPAKSASRNRHESLAHSALADVALIISMLAAALGCLGAVIGGLMYLFKGDLVAGLVLAPLAFFLQLGMLVVFMRVQEI